MLRAADQSTINNQEATPGGFYGMADIVRMPPRIDPATGRKCYPDSNSRSRLPISRTAWLRGIKQGIYPKPIKLGQLNVWPKSVIHQLELEIASGRLNAPVGK